MSGQGHLSPLRTRGSCSIQLVPKPTTVSGVCEPGAGNEALVYQLWLRVNGKTEGSKSNRCPAPTDAQPPPETGHPLLGSRGLRRDAVRSRVLDFRGGWETSYVLLKICRSRLGLTVPRILCSARDRNSKQITCEFRTHFVWKQKKIFTTHCLRRLVYSLAEGVGMLPG